MPLILGANSVSGYNIANSLRFNSGSADYLSRTPATTTNRKTWTWSGWVKKQKDVSPDTAYYLLSTGPTAGTDDFLFAFETSTDTIRIAARNASSTVLDLITTQTFRDYSAWYHIVFTLDTTQATSTNRAKLYVNGTQVSAFGTATYPSQNTDLRINVAQLHTIGTIFDAASRSGRYFNGYLSEVYLIDGQALTPSSFGETDTLTGIWKPKAYAGSYGTNGFFLKFADSASLGTDSSGNGNTWTVNNLTSIDQTTDTSTNNFATWNPLFFLGNQTFTEGNLRLATGTTGGSIGTIAVNTGKWYWESKIISTATANARVAGICSLPNVSLQSTGTVYYRLTGVKELNGTDSAYGASLTTNDIVSTAIDVDARSVTFYKNGVSQGAISLSSVYSVGDYITASMSQSSSTSTTMEINFGNPSFTIASGNTDGAGFGNFEYAVPSGYYALCTKNLATFG
jgi:hypothetical protein